MYSIGWYSAGTPPSVIVPMPSICETLSAWPARSSVPLLIFATSPRQSQSAVRRASSNTTPAHVNAAPDGICAAKSPENTANVLASGAEGVQFAAFVASSSAAPVQRAVPIVVEVPTSGSTSGPDAALVVSCSSVRPPFHTRTSS